MAETSQLVATFILNAIWQITAITALAFLCTKLLHRAPSRFAHGVWIAALGACLLIPTATVVFQHREATGRASELAPIAQPEPAAEPSARAIPVSFHSLSRSVSFSPRILYALLWVYGIVLLFHVARLAWFGYQTRRVCQLAYPRPLPPALTRIVEHCARSLSLPCVSVLCTAELSGPATLGFGRPLLLLPETFFLDAFPEDDLSSAISHELAHALRRDFPFNLLYEIASLPVRFHPCVALILSRIAQTRELACDEIAARMLPTPKLYASSLLHIAQSMFTGARSNYALGLFDTNTLEERIMNILKNNDTRRKTRAVRLIAVCLIGAASIGLSAFVAPHQHQQLGGTGAVRRNLGGKVSGHNVLHAAHPADQRVSGRNMCSQRSPGMGRRGTDPDWQRVLDREDPGGGQLREEAPHEDRE